MHQKARPAQGYFLEDIHTITLANGYLNYKTKKKHFTKIKKTKLTSAHIHTPKTSYIAPKNSILQHDEKHFDLSLVIS